MLRYFERLRFWNIRDVTEKLFALAEETVKYYAQNCKIMLILILSAFVLRVQEDEETFTVIILL